MGELTPEQSVVRSSRSRAYAISWGIAFILLVAIGSIRTLQIGAALPVFDHGPNASTDTIFALLNDDRKAGPRIRELLGSLEEEDLIVLISPASKVSGAFLDQMLACESVPRPFKIRSLADGETISPDDSDLEKCRVIFFRDMTPPAGFPPAKALTRRLSFLIK